MKNKFISLNTFASLAIIASSILTSCSKDDDNTPTPNPAGTSTISGTITSDQVWTSGSHYILAGGVHVKEGVTLTIQPGVTVTSSKTEPTVAYLLIERGAKIMAEGTKTAPIVFTSGQDNPARGDWGGIIICGKAPINNGTEATAEVGDVLYGGNVSDDNSGVLKYIRCEYTGNAINSEKEHNGFTFNGVGAETLVEYLQVYLGNDDGYEFFGGTVNARYLVSTGSKDDSFDWTYGWSGKGQFWVGQQASDIGDRAGIEADNNGSDNTATPYSNPTLSNLTFIGAEDGDGSNQGLKLREGTKVTIYNMICSNMPKRGVQVEHDVTLTNLENGDIVIKGSIVDGANRYVYTNSDGTSFVPTSPFEDDASNTGSDASFLNGYIGTSTTSAQDPQILDSWFSAGSFIGAVEAGNDWTAGWTRAL
jgi:hypothetical protein